MRVVRRVLLVVAIVIPIELVISTGVMELQRRRAEQATIEAEVLQEPYRGTDWGRAYWEEIAGYNETWTPYIVYRVSDRQGRFINVTNGVRKTYRVPGLDDIRRPTVLIFGGSAAWGHGARDAETIPSWLSRTAEQHGQSWDVRNYAESGWVNWQGIVYLLEKLADGERPDAVIFYAGVNEMRSGRQWPQVRRPIFDPVLYWDAIRERNLAIHRPLERLWDYYRHTSLIATTLLPPAPPVHSTPAETATAAAKRIAKEYLADKAVVEALGRQYGFRSFFVWQPTVASKPILSAQEQRYAGWLPASAESRPTIAWWSMDDDLRSLYMDIGREVTSQSDVIDLAGVFESVTETAFIDWIHTSESGNRLVACGLYDRVASELGVHPAVR
jgi:hypothetical protein